MTENNDIITPWADAHVFYNMYLHKPGQISSKIKLDEFLWRNKIVNETPNGKLFVQNSFFENLKKSDRVYLAHLTYELDEIVENKVIFSSGGCLIGSIYCVPLIPEDGKLRLHNLGVYISEIEAPMMRKDKKKKEYPEVLIFEIKTDKDAHHNLIGIDYLRLGTIHYSIYKQLEYLLSYKERFKLYETIISKMKKSLDYLTLCSEFYYQDEKIDPDNFLNTFVTNIKFLPILGYLYFEVIAEYLMLFQDNAEARKYAEIGELYTHTHKELMYTLEPKLKKNFKLSSFKPSLSSLFLYLAGSNVFKKFDADHFKHYLADRLIYLTNARLLGENHSAVDWRRFHWDFNNVDQYVKPLLGHLIHRELRNFGRYPSFYFYFDQTKALQVWNYWNHMDIEIPFNGVIPKGEVGINPALPHLDYKVYRGKYIRNTNFKYVEPVEELNIKIEAKLVDLRYSNMHDKIKIKD